MESVPFWNFFSFLRFTLEYYYYFLLMMLTKASNDALFSSICMIPTRYRACIHISHFIAIKKYCFSIDFSFSFFEQGHAYGLWKILDQGLNLSHGSGNAGSLTAVPQNSSNSFCFVLFFVFDGVFSILSI